eukprot:SAG31_NODE_28657_length_407_cov_0.331169_2_plen_34_part_01
MVVCLKSAAAGERLTVLEVVEYEGAKVLRTPRGW